MRVTSESLCVCTALPGEGEEEPLTRPALLWASLCLHSRSLRAGGRHPFLVHDKMSVVVHTGTNAPVVDVRTYQHQL